MQSSRKSLCLLTPLLLAVLAANGQFAEAQTVQQPRKQGRLSSSLGKQTFASSCAACHGLDGKGGERAPNIADNSRVQRLSDAQISAIIANGIAGTAMPAFHSLQASDVKAVVAYLRTLQGTNRALKLPGSLERGEIIFFGKANCSSCHMVAGKGGFIASDVSGYGRTHSAEQIRSAITDPPSANDRLARLVTVSMRGGEKYSARIRNEDNFSLQLQTLDGTFHFILKSNIETLDYDTKSLMPSDYASTLTSDELNDLASYLMKVANHSSPELTGPEAEDQ